MDLSLFNTASLFESSTDLFKQLNNRVLELERAITGTRKDIDKLETNYLELIYEPNK